MRNQTLGACRGNTAGAITRVAARPAVVRRFDQATRVPLSLRLGARLLRRVLGPTVEVAPAAATCTHRSKAQSRRERRYRDGLLPRGRAAANAANPIAAAARPHAHGAVGRDG